MEICFGTTECWNSFSCVCEAKAIKEIAPNDQGKCCKWGGIKYFMNILKKKRKKVCFVSLTVEEPPAVYPVKPLVVYMY